MTALGTARLKTSIQILAPVSRLDFFDSQTGTLPSEMTALEAWRVLNARPMPLLKYAFKVRDGISALFGVRRIKGISGDIPMDLQVGDKLDFFLVEHLSDNMLTLTVRDKHLDVMTCISVVGLGLTVTSSVITHNAFGRIYMVPVGPAHKMIVRRMLRGLVAN